MAGLNGNNKRTTDTAALEAYLTPVWGVDFLLEHWTPAGKLIVDPCACGFREWSIGRMVATRRGLPYLCSDIKPQGEAVARADFRELKSFPAESVSIVTNPPYDLLSSGEFMRWAWSIPNVIEVVILARVGFIRAAKGQRGKWLKTTIDPQQRFAFELLPEEGERRLEFNRNLPKGAKPLDVHIDPDTLTGYRMSTSGVDHGWLIYSRGYTGRKELILEPVKGALL